MRLESPLFDRHACRYTRTMWFHIGFVTPHPGHVATSISIATLIFYSQHRFLRSLCGHITANEAGFDPQGYLVHKSFRFCPQTSYRRKIIMNKLFISLLPAILSGWPTSSPLHQIECPYLDSEMRAFIQRREPFNFPGSKSTPARTHSRNKSRIRGVFLLSERTLR
jgi:hypothetical protein